MEQQIIQMFQQAMDVDPNKRKEAEKALEEGTKQQGFVLVLLSLLQNQSVQLTHKQQAAIYFKNIVKRQWNSEESILTDNDRTQIKDNLLELMVTQPKLVQGQLSATLEIISATDFPFQWPTLLPNIVTKFETKDLGMISGVLKTLKAILKKYQQEFKTENIILELQNILAAFQEPMLKFFSYVVTLVDQQKENPDAISQIFRILKLLCRIFYSLNCVDIPEYFEDHMSEYFTAFHTFLVFETTVPTLLPEEGEEKPGLLHSLQSCVCLNLNLYIEKYEEEFNPFLQQFVQDIWNLLSKTKEGAQYDYLVISAITFLTSVAKSIHWKLFEDPATLKLICQNIIRPNMQITEADEERFEDTPVDYIRRDIEGSDSDTRKRASVELVKGLRKHFETQVTEIFSGDVQVMLQDYATTKNWKQKDIAITLVSALAITSQNARDGVVNTNAAVPILNFYETQILPELTNPTQPMLVADALKFVAIFRQQIPTDHLVNLTPVFASLLGSSSEVVQTYAAANIEKIITMKDNGKPKFEFSIFQPHLSSLLTALFPAIEVAIKKYELNEYIMKAIMRLCYFAGDHIISYTPTVFEKLILILNHVIAHPSNFQFQHFLFETIALLIRTTCLKTPEKAVEFENLLIPSVQSILQNEVTEFEPYVFQILAQCLEFGEGPNVNPIYAAIFPALLTPSLWERSGNIPGLVRLLQAFIRRVGSAVTSHIEGLLGVFQKLVASKIHDHEGFYLLEAIVEFLKPSEFEPYIRQIFIILFQRLTTSKTLKFIKSFIIFLSLFVGKHLGSLVVQIVNSVDPNNQNLFQRVIEIWLEHSQKISGDIERKMVAIAFTRLLAETPEITTQYATMWPEILKANVFLFEKPEDSSVPDEFSNEFDNDEETFSGFDTTYCQLNYAVKLEPDPFKDIADTKTFLAGNLNKLSQSRPGVIVPLIKSAGEDYYTALVQYCVASNIPEPYFY